MRNILGKPCLLSIAHQESSDGKTTYANISAISNKMKSYTRNSRTTPFLPSTCQTRLGELRPPERETEEQIAKSPEYAEAVNGRQPPAPPQKQAQAAEGRTEHPKAMPRLPKTSRTTSLLIKPAVRA
ncbi:hypothetical protein [Neisseria gonorrhoeae]|uniref:hypothetical protein n=1 Tax=Neisseria gonorrhoeae TaxID=485 RepID=UPI0021CB8DC2|nr:hypothetical protein [Neisseria gonorrhoeae]